MMTVIKCKIKKGDSVLVRTGRDKGKVGTVLKVFVKDSALIVEGINIVKKHVKPSNTSQGGIITKESLIHVSNVAIIDPKLNVATKVAYKIIEGSKVRIARKSGSAI